MKKDIEWLKDEVNKIVSEYQRENIFANFTRYMIYDIEDAINQLVPKINQEEYEHINWLLKRVKKEIKRKDENLGLLDWDSRQADKLSGEIEAFEYIEMLINEIGKPSYFRNKHRESEGTEMKKDIEWLKEEIKIEIDNLWFKNKLDAVSVESLISRVNHLINQLDDLENQLMEK